MAKKHRPQRSCVVCREKKDKRDLVRLVFAHDSLVMDIRGKMQGRGAYLCRAAKCWQQAAAAKQMSRALRRELSATDREYLRQMTPL